jgi:hypothetical protein
MDKIKITFEREGAMAVFETGEDTQIDDLVAGLLYPGLIFLGYRVELKQFYIAAKEDESI